MRDKEIKVKDAMTRRIITVGENETVQKAAELMRKNRVGSLIIIRGKNPTGIITESDIIKKVVSKDLPAGNVDVEEVMSSPIKSLSPEDTLTEAAAKMINNKIRRMPVIKNGEILGILTHTDIVRVSPTMASIISERAKMREGEINPSVGESAGICEACENYSERLIPLDDEWICEDCRQEKMTE